MTCPMSRFGDGGHDRCSMGPNVGSLERASFSLKFPCLRGVEVERYVLGLQCHSSDCNFWLETGMVHMDRRGLRGISKV